MKEILKKIFRPVLRKTYKSHRWLEEELSQLLENEYVISSISSMFINLSTNEISQGIDRALNILSEFLHEDYFCVFQLSKDRQYMNMTNEICAPHLPPHIQYYQNLPLDFFPWFRKQLEKYGLLQIPNLDTLPSEASSLKELFKAEGIQATLASSMVYNNEMIGLISVSSTTSKKKWTQNHITLLKTLSEILANVCARWRAEEELLKYQGKLRSLSSELLLIEEKERRRIAVELHDRIGQTLTVSRIKLGSLRNQVSSKFSKEIDEIGDLIEQTIHDTRSLTFELSPHILYEIGLSAAIEALSDDITERYGIEIEFKDDFNDSLMEESIRVLLFQAVRELFFNMVKHANAKHAIISIKDDEGIKIDIEDDGIGFNSSDVYTYDKKKKSFGLFSIRERLSHHGGYIDINSIPSKGTHITLFLPVKSEHFYKKSVLNYDHKSINCR
ncbi:MAG: GAF domain-containing sensor histidine kinase [Desulfobacterales bacterium]|nr:GAF domain-containing sensor histidine kinase [Desulfobacterales bacterium]